MTRPFLVNDRVSAFGCDGVVFHVTELNVYVKLANHDMTFCPAGKLYYWHAEPSLKHLDPPAPKYVKKTKYTSVFDPASVVYQVCGCSLYNSVEEVFQFNPDAIGYTEIVVFLREEKE